MANDTTVQDIMLVYRGILETTRDVFGKENMTGWALPIVFAVIDKRHSSGRRTIVTTQYPNLSARLVSDGDAETAKAIASRLSEYRVIDFDGPDRRLG
jgi:DNA replication protein DnaC